MSIESSNAYQLWPVPVKTRYLREQAARLRMVALFPVLGNQTDLSDAQDLEQRAAALEAEAKALQS